jgi:hypothetical protein
MRPTDAARDRASDCTPRARNAAPSDVLLRLSCGSTPTSRHAPDAMATTHNTFAQGARRPCCVTICPARSRAAECVEPAAQSVCAAARRWGSGKGPDVLPTTPLEAVRCPWRRNLLLTSPITVPFSTCITRTLCSAVVIRLRAARGARSTAGLRAPLRLFGLEGGFHSSALPLHVRQRYCERDLVHRCARHRGPLGWRRDVLWCEQGGRGGGVLESNQIFDLLAHTHPPCVHPHRIGQGVCSPLVVMGLGGAQRWWR